MGEPAQAKQLPHAAWTIAVSTGPNRGASLTLAPGRYRVGAGPENDIVLADTGVATSQLQLDIEDGHACVTALAPGAALRRSALRTGRSRVLRPGAELQLGQTRLRVGAAAPLPRTRRTAALAGLMFLTAAGAAGGYRIASPTVRLLAPAAAAAIPAMVTATNAASLFQTHLDEAGLGIIHLDAADSAVLATGTLAAADMPGWAAAGQWFDGQFGSQVALVASITRAEVAGPPPLEVAAILTIPVPHVITRSGERYMTGAVLPGGWTITAITPDRVTLQSGTREIGITL